MGCQVSFLRIRGDKSPTECQYATPIEPSAQGGDKIAATIAALVTTHDFAQGRTAIYTQPTYDAHDAHDA
jgi:hypothetical protein